MNVCMGDGSGTFRQFQPEQPAAWAAVCDLGDGVPLGSTDW